MSRLWRAFDGLGADTAWTLVHDLLAMVVAFTSFMMLIRVFSPQTMGGVYAIYALVGPLSSLTFAGPGLALLQRRIRFNDSLDDIVRSFMSVSLLLGIATASFAVAFAFWKIDQLTNLEIVLIVISELFANSMIFVCSMLTQAAVSYPAMIRVRLVVVALKLIVLVALFTSGNLTIRNMALGYVIFYGAYALWLLFRYLPSIGCPVRLGRPTETAVKTSATFALPIAAANLQLDGDKLALNSMGFQTQAGLYGAAYRVVHFGALPIRVIGQAAFHRFLADDEDGAAGQLRKAAKLSAFMFLVALITSGAIAIIAATPLIDMVLEDEFSEAKSMLPWLLLSLPMLALSGTPMNGLLGLGRDKERAAVFISAAILSVALYLLLIPTRGWQGAVAATLGSEAYLAIASWMAMVHYQRISDREDRSVDPDPPGGGPIEADAGPAGESIAEANLPA